MHKDQLVTVLFKVNLKQCIFLLQASIDVLLKFALGKTTGRGKGAKSKKSGGSEASGILKRPIICICNDVYVPALRPLRQAAFVVHFPPTAPARQDIFIRFYTFTKCRYMFISVITKFLDHHYATIIYSSANIPSPTPPSLSPSQATAQHKT